MIKINVGMMLLPHMLREILHDSLGMEPDIELIDLSEDSQASLQHRQLDAVLVPCDSKICNSVSAILARQPRLVVLAFTRNAKLAYLYRIERQSYGEPSTDSLLVILRSLTNRSLNEDVRGSC